jgi:hypothetical protein
VIDEIGSAPDPKPKNGRYTVGLVYEDFNSQVELQILRDLWVLQQKWDLAVRDYGGRVSSELLRLSNLETTEDEAGLNLVYKTGEEWPYADPDVQQVRRDLEVKEADIGLDPNPKIGYYLRPQGRDGANLTELYLNRTAPRGNGLSDALIVYLWG